MVCELQALGLEMKIMGTDAQGQLQELDVKINEGTVLAPQYPRTDIDSQALVEEAESEEKFMKLVGESFE